MELHNCSLFFHEISTYSVSCWIMCYLPLVITNMVQCQFLSFVFIIKQYFSMINEKLSTFVDHTVVFGSSKRCEKLKSEVQVKKITSVEIINLFRIIHFQLCALSRVINKLFSLQILFLTANTFISLTSLTYFCFASFSKIFSSGNFNPYHTFTTFTWSLIKFLQIFVLSVLCSSTTHEVSKTTWDVLNKTLKLHES